MIVSHMVLRHTFSLTELAIFTLVLPVLTNVVSPEDYPHFKVPRVHVAFSGAL